MLAYNLLVFDELIKDTGNYYTSTALASRLGNADELCLFARTTHVSGTSPTLTVEIEHSPNGQDWAPTWTPQVSALPISNEGAYAGQLLLFDPALLAHVRLRIALGGTSPACRLKLYATGRSRGG